MADIISEGLVKRCSKIMEDEFGFSPKESSLNFYTKEGWREFTKQREVDAIGGVFFPFDLSAHAPDVGDRSLPYIIHEYFGHGSFCELTPVGKKIRGYDKQMRANEESEKGKAWDSLMEKYESFFFDNTWLFEGFAVWLEGFLLPKIGYGNLWKERKKELGEYLDYYDHFKLFESKAGPLSLVYKCGFPKDLRKEKILQAFNENIKDSNNLVFLVHYGSMNPNSDIDLLAVFEDLPDERIFFDSSLDAFMMGKACFENKIKMMDLSVTDALKTGCLIFGNEQDYAKTVNSVRCNSSPDVLCYLRRMSLEYFNSAQRLFSEGIFQGNLGLLNSNSGERVLEEADFPNTNFAFALNNICFAISYSLAFSYYLNGGSSILAFDDLLKMEGTSLLKKVRHFLKDCPSRDATKSALEETRKFLML